jgi:hypothetical protein
LPRRADAHELLRRLHGVAGTDSWHRGNTGIHQSDQPLLQNELDLRFAKILRFGRTRTNVGVDLYNIMNSAPVLAYNQAYVPTGAWLTPTSVFQARFFKISAQIDF